LNLVDYGLEAKSGSGSTLLTTESLLRLYNVDSDAIVDIKRIYM